MIQIDGLKDTVDSGIEIGRGISEIGFVAVAAGFFVLFAIMTMLFNYYILKRLINDLVRKKDTDDSNLNSSITKLAQYLEPMSNESVLRNMDTLKKIAEKEFDLSIEKVNNIVLTMRVENHIHENVPEIRAKLMRLLTNIHRERNLYFSSFKFSGHSLSYFTNPKWPEMVFNVAVSELYNEYDNPKRTKMNIKSIYEEIKIEFGQNLLNK